MGFNKRIINNNKLKEVYLKEGFQGLTKYITNPDSITTEGDCGEIISIILDETCGTNKELKIKKIWQIWDGNPMKGIE